MRAIVRSFSPFWAESTNPSAARWGRICAIAASVAGAFTASTTRRHWPESRSGVTQGTTWRKLSTGPSIASPSVEQARACSATMSTMRTGMPARAHQAPRQPPIAPAPQISTSSVAAIAQSSSGQGPSSAARVSSTPVCHSLCIASSGIW
ncbi:MAG: hypothetical protein KatS3mg118_2281 [Paracoccaceae bacterium]|nr:MAG: hypothetical protein KatS3mg118_2281 [Paracoccaceae bacterium]